MKIRMLRLNGDVVGTARWSPSRFAFACRGAADRIRTP